jgi:hypothetical protein
MAPARAVVALGSTTLLIPKTVTSMAAAATDTAITVRARKEVVIVMAISREPQSSMLEDYRSPDLEAVMHITKRRFLPPHAHRAPSPPRLSSSNRTSLKSRPNCSSCILPSERNRPGFALGFFHAPGKAPFCDMHHIFAPASALVMILGMEPNSRSMERIMQNPGRQLVTVEFNELWSAAQVRRGEFLAVWCGELRDRFRAAMRRHQLSMEPKLQHFEGRIAASVRSKLAADMAVRQVV